MYADENTRECRTSVLGKEYIGDINTTTSGLTCQFWTAQYPNQHSFTRSSIFPDNTLEDAANYCRNPDGSKEPWCYTADDPVKFWGYCDVPMCKREYMLCFASKVF
jgi:hypothetical protein